MLATTYETVAKLCNNVNFEKFNETLLISENCTVSLITVVSL